MNKVVISNAEYNRIIEKVNRCQLFGKTRDIVHALHNGIRYVAVGDELIYGDWKTFPTFLMHYCKYALGEEWFSHELEEAEANRHEICRWYGHVDSLLRASSNSTSINETVVRIDGDGVFMAYMHLAYNLYVLAHHAALQARLISRLKHKDQFQGALYEVFVITTMIRAGFDIAFEDETDGSTSHPEFIATHQLSKQRIAVEAKSRHRPGVLGRSGNRQDPDDLTLGVRNLLLKCSQKHIVDPYVVFIDLNMPSGLFHPGNSIAEDDIANEVANLNDARGNSQFNMVVITNTPHVYGAPFETAPPISVCVLIPTKPKFQAVDFGLLKEIQYAAAQHVNIPSWFPE